jgi:hypothetical protein
LNGKQGSATGKVQAEAGAFLRAFTKVRRLEDSPIPKRTASTITHAQTVPAGRFVRCSSEFPFLPGAQRAYQIAREGSVGKLLEVRSGFHHGSDLDPTKPVNWKRQVKT